MYAKNSSNWGEIFRNSTETYGTNNPNFKCNKYKYYNWFQLYVLVYVTRHNKNKDTLVMFIKNNKTFKRISAKTHSLMLF